jgi:uncharacterized protein YeaO (DUF488 family)
LLWSQWRRRTRLFFRAAAAQYKDCGGNGQQASTESELVRGGQMNIMLSNLAFEKEPQLPVLLKRVYERPSLSDGKRVLVDRLWPRGLTKAQAQLDRWLRDLAPSDELRRWFHERPQYFNVFRKRYLKELAQPDSMKALEELYALVEASKKVTLVYASKNTDCNNASVLKELLEGMRKPPSSSGPARAIPARIAARR